MLIFSSRDGWPSMGMKAYTDLFIFITPSAHKGEGNFQPTIGSTLFLGGKASEVANCSHKSVAANRSSIERVHSIPSRKKTRG